MPRYNVFYRPWLRGRTVQKDRVEAPNEKKARKELLRKHPNAGIVAVFQIEEQKEVRQV